jgi:excisionase family DNA binding protein
MPLNDKNKTTTPSTVPAVTKSAFPIQPTKKILPTNVSAATVSSLPKKWAGNLERIGVSAEEAAVMLDLSVRSIWVLVKDKRIRHVRFGMRVIISVQSLREFVDGKQDPITHSVSIDES